MVTEPNEVWIGGRLGEGGGQVLRSALALSLGTRRAIRVDAIRAGRSRAGLLPQHLASVRAAATAPRSSARTP